MSTSPKIYLPSEVAMMADTVTAASRRGDVEFNLKTE